MATAPAPAPPPTDEPSLAKPTPTTSHGGYTYKTEPNGDTRLVFNPDGTGIQPLGTHASRSAGLLSSPRRPASAHYGRHGVPPLTPSLHMPPLPPPYPSHMTAPSQQPWPGALLASLPAPLQQQWAHAMPGAKQKPLAISCSVSDDDVVTVTAADVEGQAWQVQLLDAHWAQPMHAQCTRPVATFSILGAATRQLKVRACATTPLGTAGEWCEWEEVPPPSGSQPAPAPPAATPTAAPTAAGGGAGAALLLSGGCGRGAAAAAATPGAGAETAEVAELRAENARLKEGIAEAVAAQAAAVEAESKAAAWMVAEMQAEVEKSKAEAESARAEAESARAEARAAEARAAEAASAAGLTSARSEAEREAEREPLTPSSAALLAEVRADVERLAAENERLREAASPQPTRMVRRPSLRYSKEEGAMVEDGSGDEGGEGEGDDEGYIMMRDVIERAFQAADDKRVSSGGTPLPRSASGVATPAAAEDELSWRTKPWLESLTSDVANQTILEVISIVLLAPLQAEVGSGPIDQMLEEAFVRGLGENSSAEPISRVLKEGGVVEKLAEMLWDSARRLSEGSAKEAGANYASKFFEAETASGSSLTYGGLSSFFGGLDDFIGPPNPNLREAMETEHCASADSKMIFAAPNYGTETTSELEYWFVAEPTDERLEKLRQSLANVKITDDGGEALHWPSEAEGKAPKQRRRPLDLKEHDELNLRNGQLRDRGMAPLVEEEVIGARLYTGPMYVKYNSVLRDIGTLRSRSADAFLSGDQLGDLLRAVSGGRDSSTQGNLYTTTLHVINSAVIKLSKLTTANKVYRGISRKVLPKAMQEKDEDNVRGGIEFGFTSCSTERSEAMHYATQGGAQKKGATSTPILLEMQMGMIDRGADLAWISQYAGEAEILFAPLTGVELLSHRVVDDILIVAVRPSINLSALTIEQVVAKMKTSHVQLLDLLTDNLRFAGVPSKALAPLSTLKLEAGHREPAWYNSTANYRKATNDALDRQLEVFQLLVNGEGGEGGGVGPRAAEPGSGLIASMDPQEIRTTALVTARAGEHRLAVELLLLWRQCTVRRREEEKRRRLERAAMDDKLEVGPFVPIVETVEEALLAAAESIVIEGLDDPWPATLTVLASRETWGIKVGCLDMGRFTRFVADFVQRTGTADPFRENADVLVMTSPKLQGRWEKAKLVKRNADGTCDVANWRKHTKLRPEHVLAPCVGGVAAALREAAAAGDASVVRALLDARANVFQTDHEANHALIMASGLRGRGHAGHEEVVRLLLERAPALKALRNKQRQQAYDLAVGTKQQKLVRIFEPNASDSDVAAADAERFRALLADGGDVSGLDTLEWSNGVTSLMLACRLGETELARGLAEVAGERLHAKTASGCTALTMAAEEGHAEIAATLLAAKADPDAFEPSKGHCALFYAAVAGHVGVVEALIGASVNINARRRRKGSEADDGRTALMLAAQHGYTVTLLRLLDAGADVNAVNQRGETALSFGARFGQLGATRVLIEHKTDLTIETAKPSWTSLHKAAANGHLHVAEKLLNAHPPLVTHQDGRDGQTALTAAAGSGFATMASVLLLNGASTGRTNKEGQNAVWVAAQSGQEEALRSLLEHLKGAAGEDGVAALDVKAEAAGQPMSPLMVAAHYGHEGAVRVLLGAKADVAHGEAGDVEKDVLMLAAVSGHKDIVRLLMAHGATARLDDAIDAANENKDYAMSGLLHKPRVTKHRQVRKAKAAMALQRSNTATYLLPEYIDGAFNRLGKFDGKYGGHLVPPRPSEEQLAAGMTPTGALSEHQGVVMQQGPFRGIWLRAGCVSGVPWHRLWETLKTYVTHFVARETKVAEEGKTPAGIYVAVSQRSMQAVDFKWLSEHGFRFHHYRKPGHGDLAEAGEEPPPADEHTSPEFVYYCWPGKPSEDKVPAYATSIEGATGLLLSVDESKLLLVWERGAWSTPGGAVDPGEMKLDTLKREVWEEVNVKLDLEWDAVFVGGWQQSRARDNLINDNFSAFVVRVATDDFKADDAEIQEAGWFEWRPFLEAWRSRERPMGERKVPMDELLADRPEKRRVVNLNLLKWLDTYESGKGMPCKIKRSTQADKAAAKVAIGW